MTPVTVTDALSSALGEAPPTPEPAFQAISVREKPPLRLAVDVETPNGRHYRWGDDEPNPANVPSGLRFSSTMPGGYESMDCVLPRRPGIDYSDLERLSTLTVYGPGGEVVGEYRLERTPRTSGDEMSVSPSAVGWQAELEDDKSFTAIYRDTDLARFGEISATRRLSLFDAGWGIEQSGVKPDAESGAPTIEQLIPSAEGGTRESPPICETAYDAGPNRIASLYYRLETTANVASTFEAYVQAHDDDSYAAGEASADIITAPNATFAATRTFTAGRRVVTLTFRHAGTTGFTAEFPVYWRVVLYGDHGLTVRGVEPDAGFFASDIVAHAVRDCSFRSSEGPDGTIRPSGFLIPHMTFPGMTTRGEVVRQASRFGLEDWAVWDRRTFWWHERGTLGRRWRARVGPSGLEETGPQVDRLWESVIVQFQDVDGTTKTVGPPGSRADVETSALKDSDPDNPANQLGIPRRDLLAMGVSTVAGATEVGRRFLEEQKLLDRSGRAQFVGHIEDDRGVVHAASKVRAGDYVSFVDASDTSYRRIVRADFSHANRTCTVDLDSPPEGLAALLERLGVVLIPLGF